MELVHDRNVEKYLKQQFEYDEKLALLEKNREDEKKLLTNKNFNSKKYDKYIVPVVFIYLALIFAFVR